MVAETQPFEDHLNPWCKVKQRVTAVAETDISLI